MKGSITKGSAPVKINTYHTTKEFNAHPGQILRLQTPDGGVVLGEIRAIFPDGRVAILNTFGKGLQEHIGWDPKSEARIVNLNEAKHVMIYADRGSYADRQRVVNRVIDKSGSIAPPMNTGARDVLHEALSVGIGTAF